jgi:O-antigen ligase
MLWLAAIGALALRWGSPLGGAIDNAILSDLLIAAAAAFFAADLLRGRARIRWQPWHLWLAGYAAWIAIAGVPAIDRHEALQDFLLVAELAVLAVMTASFASEPVLARLLARVTLAAALFTAALALVGLLLFSAGHETQLLGRYGDLAESSKYARVRAGFASAPLLASWCIAASAIIAWPRGDLPRNWRIAGQLALAFVVLGTLARGVLAFGVAMLVRWAAASPTRSRVTVAVGAAVAVVAILALLTIGNLTTNPISYDSGFPGPRRQAVVTSWHTFRDDPVFGIGPGTDPGIYLAQRFRAHLTPLQVAATSGLPALIALVGLFVALWRGRSRPTDIAIWSGIAGLLLDGMVQDIDHFRHVWLLIGLAAVATSRDREVVSTR